MDDSVSTADNAVRSSFGGCLAYWAALCSLLVVHGSLTLQLFGPTHAWRQLLNEEPLTSGRHALHLQQGALGAAAIRSAGTDSAYDPSEYAGYPRSPVIDAESRPAEWFQLLVRRRFGAAAYKVGLAITYWLLPVILWSAARCRPTCRGCAILSATLAVLVAWSGPANDLIEGGDWCVPLMAVVAVLGLALFVRWNNQPSVSSWCGLALVAMLGWYIQPSLCWGYVAVGLGAWAILARRHRWRWHIATAMGQVAALALSYPAWCDWLRDWWVRMPIHHASMSVTVREIIAIGLWLTILPAARVLTATLKRLAVRPFATLFIGSVLCLATAGVAARRPDVCEQLTWGPRPLSIGLGPDACALEECIRAATTADSRILWEDLPDRADLGWTVLLPGRIGRPFVGGLDAEGVLEHAACALRGGALAGRPLSEWSDAELDGYARRYNIGCVVCASAAARDRFAHWAVADTFSAKNAIGDWRIFVIHRPHSFVLKGQAQNFEADSRRVTMSDVIPENGEVVLSLHYQEGWRVRPTSVRVERELDPFDSIPFIRLRLPGPISRVTLTWDAR